MKDRLELKDVVLVGRTFEEYCAFFQLKHDDLASGNILDMGAGTGSFCAEAAQHGYSVTPADPIYDSEPEAIARKSRADLDEVMRQLPGLMHKYNWSYYADPGELGGYREQARRLFLEDYVRNHHRYIHAALPDTRFESKQFSLVLVSHFLFLYDDWFDYEFHKASILELGRLAGREIRIYPLVNMSAARSSHVEQLMSDPACSALRFEVVGSDFEFFKSANQLLIIRTQ
jgi:SAM-dependent methyltransferase